MLQAGQAIRAEWAVQGFIQADFKKRNQRWESLFPAAAPVSLWCCISPEPAPSPQSCAEGRGWKLPWAIIVVFGLSSPAGAKDLLPPPISVADPASPLPALHQRGWHNEPCPCLNLLLPLSPVSVCAASWVIFSFLFLFFSPLFLPLFSSGSQAVLAHSPRWRPPLRVTFPNPIG